MAGAGNDLVIETEYPDLVAFEREHQAFTSDPESMKLPRSMADHVVQGSARDGLWQTAPQIA